MNSGGRGILYFRALDASSGVARATITARDRQGRTVLSMRLRRGNWGMSPSPRYYWWPFDCRLQPGTYRLEVRARDRAGNRQVTVGRGRLQVVSSGAPAQRRPHWPAGLPYDAGGYGVRLGGDDPAAAVMKWRPAIAAVEGASLPESMRWARAMRAAH